MGSKSAIINLTLLVAIPIFIFVYFEISPKEFGYSDFDTIVLILLKIGLFLLLISKLPLFKKGVFTSFGSKKMSRISKIIYRISYVFISIGIIMFLLKY